MLKKLRCSTYSQDNVKLGAHFSVSKVVEFQRIRYIQVESYYTCGTLIISQTNGIKKPLGNNALQLSVCCGNFKWDIKMCEGNGNNRSHRERKCPQIFLSIESFSCKMQHHTVVRLTLKTNFQFPFTMYCYDA